MKSAVKGRFHPCRDLDIEAYLCDELAEAERARFEQQLSENEPLQSYIAERKAAQAEFARSHPLLPTSVAAGQAVERQGKRDRSRGLIIGLPGVSLLAVAAAFALLATKPPTSLERRSPSAAEPAASASDRVRVKGDGLHAVLYVKRGDEVFQHQARVPLRAGDRIRLGVEATHGGYLSVLARDERGRFSVYYDGLRIASGRFLVPDSLLLDGDFRAERWLVVVAEERRASEAYLAGWREGKLPPARYTTLELGRGAP